ncbi:MULTISPECIES: VacJ family lipoprotein [unclassified Luteimonas]|uniref:MlaA family lipoprotein n=1 Tax=unclassified Luteimonas TaxID=2629088 RepID=UPI0018F08DF3|nr:MULTISPECIES: VacJ family lipoprotein [unclassified Luteimonas]MBJ6979747.1 VacJ family lipoprotein [Luteimonas sp. MC1895]MBJ6985562.1 VacJ family lipoprotein [Luteimonas sp. MC1750]QQO05956.1 VacJ family lipoprotein [Luteimonas sp. MC1750]
MHSPSSTPRRLAVFALGVALLAGCAGTAPRAPAPSGAMPVAATEAPAPTAGDAAGHGQDAATSAAVDVPPDAATNQTGDGALAVEEDPGGAPMAADGSGAPAAQGPVSAATQAELDFAAIYGGDVYDPIADPTLPEPATVGSPGHDPWENWNRRVHGFNMAIDRAVAEPLARAYVKVVPRPLRLGVGNFFSNLGQPVSALNALLQGKPKQAGQSLGRFVVNATIGMAGLFDPATHLKIPNRSEDFGQTLGVWGWEQSRFVELPLFGPRTVRDVFGLVGDGQVSPTRQINDDTVRIGLQGLQLVDLRTQLFAVDRLREGAADEYALVRDAWMQRRNYQIHGDRIRRDQQQDLPDYLLDDETNPTVPVDVMPIIPGSSPP